MHHNNCQDILCLVSGYFSVKKIPDPHPSAWQVAMLCAEVALSLQAVLRIEGANIIPFTANNLNIFVTAVVTQLPNVTAKDIVISQVSYFNIVSLP